MKPLDETTKKQVIFMISFVVFTVIVLYSSLVMHEIGHYLMAKILGQPIKDIILFNGFSVKLEQKLSITSNTFKLIAFSGGSFSALILIILFLIIKPKNPTYMALKFTCLWFSIIEVSSAIMETFTNQIYMSNTPIEKNYRFFGALIIAFIYEFKIIFTLAPDFWVFKVLKKYL